MSEPPTNLLWTTRIHTAVFVIIILAAWSLVGLSKSPCTLMVILPLTFLVIQIINAQWQAVMFRSETGAAISGLIQFLIALIAAGIFAVNACLLYIWNLAPLLVMGAVVVGYGSYWMAWQNWIWIQHLRGTQEDDLPIPRTLSLIQLMLLMGAISALCGLAAMVKHSVDNS